MKYKTLGNGYDALRSALKCHCRLGVCSIIYGSALDQGSIENERVEDIYPLAETRGKQPKERTQG